MNQRDQRRQNQELVLSLLRSCSPISQTQLSERARLQPSTTSNLIRALKEKGIVASVGKQRSGPQGGKKADILALKAEYGQFGGIYIKEDEVIFGVVDFTGGMIARKQLSVSGVGDTELLGTLVAEISGSAGSYPAYRGTGIAVSSIVRLNGDVAKSLHFARAIPAIISEIRRNAPDFPVVVDNDANCAADWDLFGSGDEVRNIVHLQVQTTPVTIGAGIIIDGALYRGTTGAAGEIEEQATPGSEKQLLDRIVSTARAAATFLDSEAVYIAGELAEESVGELKVRAARLEETIHKRILVLDNPDLPVFGAALQAIRLHMNQVLGEQ